MKAQSYQQMLQTALVVIGSMLTMPLACKDGSQAPKVDTPEASANQATSTSVSLAISCGAVGQEFSLCKEGVEAWSKKTGHKAQVVSTPNSPTERLAMYQQMLAAKASDIDVYQIDVIWPGILANHLVDLKSYAGGIEKKHFASIIRNNTVDGRLVAMPWFTDAGLLYYRQDLLKKHQEKPPETWADMTRIAQKIQTAERSAGNTKMWGFVWQGKAYEGLTCNGLEWIASHGGGTIVDADGTVSVNNAQAAQALQQAAGWVGTISPKGVLNYTEEEARGVFQSGNAVFMRNWPYAWALAQGKDSAIKGKVGVAPIPKGGAKGRHAGVLGGWQLAISNYSKHPKEAADLILYLTGKTEQKRRALTGSIQPTWVEVYKDQEVLSANPFFGDLLATFQNTVARPSTITGTRYNQVSNRFWNTTHRVLAGKSQATEALAQLQQDLGRLRPTERR